MCGLSWLSFVDVEWTKSWHVPLAPQNLPFLCTVPLLLLRWTLQTHLCPLVHLCDMRTIMIVYSVLLNVMQDCRRWTYVLSCQRGTALHVMWTASHSMSFCSMPSGAVSVCNQIAQCDEDVTTSFLSSLKVPSFISCGMLLSYKYRLL